jgi:hypothetical protein
MRVTVSWSGWLLLLFWLDAAAVVAQPVAPPVGDSPEPSPDSFDAAPAVTQPVAPPVGDSSEPSLATPAGPTNPPPPPPSAADRPDLTVWVTAGWGDAIGPARCKDGKLERGGLANNLAATLKRSVEASGIAISAAGALSDHPLIVYAARHDPDLLARVFAEMGYSALALGVSDLSGPLLRYPALSRALTRHGIQIVASNLQCGGQAWCQDWTTAEDPLPILERDGHRYAFIALLPDDALNRAEPEAGRELKLLPALQTLIEQTERARAVQVDFVIASIDHGPDATASGSVASFVSELPKGARPDLVLSPSSAENLLFLRPLDVNPAVAGTRAGALTSIRVKKLTDGDSDVITRGVPLKEPSAVLDVLLEHLARPYCAASSRALPGGKLDAELDAPGLVQLAALSARQLARADLAVVDPAAFEAEFSQPAGARLQQGEVERAVQLDSPLVVADVSLDWLTALNKRLDGPRPLALFGAEPDDGAPAFGGRAPVPGAFYRIVTSAVLARSGRLPDGADWSALDLRDASLRRAMLSHLSAARSGDPRGAFLDPGERTQWLLRADGQLQGNLTAVKNPSNYDEPTLQSSESRELIARLVMNMDADAPKFLFENLLQIAFNRNFATKSTSQDFDFLQSTYTYRGLWPTPLLYPHPFVEGYVETQIEETTKGYHHLLLRPEAGLRSLFSHVLSLKLSGGLEIEVFGPDQKPQPSMGAELVMKPWTFIAGSTAIQMEGNVSYLWISPTDYNQHTLRARLIVAFQIIGPLQFTMTSIGVLRAQQGGELGQGLSVQAGLRLRFIERMMSN